MRDISPLVFAYLREGVQDFFRQQAGPDGPWQSLTQATIEAKGHARILEESGRLEAALTSRTPDSVVEITRMSLTWGVNLFYAVRHEAGLLVPRRGFMPYGDQVDDFVARRATEHILGITPGSLGGPLGFERT